MSISGLDLPAWMLYCLCSTERESLLDTGRRPVKNYLIEIKSCILKNL